MKNDFKSALMLSCHNEKHLKKIPSLEAECIMLNLEDGVSSEQKPLALKLCAKYLDIYKDEKKMFIVRVNALDDGGLEEIKYLNIFAPDAVRVPKVKTSKDVEKVLNILDENIELHLSIETASAWNNLSNLRVHDRVKCFYLGILDLFADMKLPQTLINIDNPTILYILSHFLITCKSIGVKPVSFVFQDYKNMDAFLEWINLEKEMGYCAKGCISPQQSHMVNEIFKAQDELIQRAKNIVKLFEEYRENGITGFSHEKYGFIDEPIYKGALALLDK